MRGTKGLLHIKAYRFFEPCGAPILPRSPNSSNNYFISFVASPIVTVGTIPWKMTPQGDSEKTSRRDCLYASKRVVACLPSHSQDTNNKHDNCLRNFFLSRVDLNVGSMFLDWTSSSSLQMSNLSMLPKDPFWDKGDTTMSMSLGFIYFIIDSIPHHWH